MIFNRYFLILIFNLSLYLDIEQGLLSTTEAQTNGTSSLFDQIEEDDLLEEEEEDDYFEEFENCDYVQPEKGDIVEFQRKYLSHFGIYIGYGHIIHLKRVATLKQFYYLINKIENVAGPNLCRVNNMEDEAEERNLTVKPIDHIIQCAFDNLYESVQYNLFTNNSEIFVTRCRFGTGFSIQGETMDTLVDILLNTTINSLLEEIL